MRGTHDKNFNHGNSSSDPGASLRYLKGRDLKEIEQDDPDFFVKGTDVDGNVSLLSSSRRILRKIPRKQKKEVH